MAAADLTVSRQMAVADWVRPFSFGSSATVESESGRATAVAVDDRCTTLTGQLPCVGNLMT
jgi:hypothetical protein